MKSKDVFIGMVVIPHQKTAGFFGLKEWAHPVKIEDIPPLKVAGWDKENKCWSLMPLPVFREIEGGLFYAKDFEPYNTPHKMVKFLDTGKEFRQFQVGDLHVYRFMDVFLATGWAIVFANWPINVSRIVTPIYIEGEYIQAYEMEFGNLIEEIK